MSFLLKLEIMGSIPIETVFGHVIRLRFVPLVPKYTMRLSELLFENQNPKKFWLVFDIPNWDKEPTERALNMIEDISKGELRGLKGISGSREILTEWWMIARNAAVMMDANEVIRLNDIEQIHYDDPEYLCRNNFKALYRLWDINPERKYGKQQMMLRLAQYTVRAIYKKNSFIGSSLEYQGFANNLSDAWEDNPAEVQSVSDAQRALFRMVGEIKKGLYTERQFEDLTFDLFATSLVEALIYIGNLYSVESEWLVKSDVFKIPANSTMLVGVDFNIVKTFSEWKKNPDKPEFFIRRYAYENYERLTRIIHENNLHKRYKIKLVDSRKWEEIRPQVTARRRK